MVGEEGWCSLMNLKDAIETAWTNVVERYRQENSPERQFGLYWREEVLMLYFFHFLMKTGIKIRQVASKEEFLFLERGHEPDLVISADTDEKIERAVIEAKFFWAKEADLENDWMRLRRFKEVFFDGGYMDYGCLLTFVSDDFRKDKERIDGYEMRSLTYKVPSNVLWGRSKDLAHGILKKALRKWQPEYDTDEQGNPFAFLKDKDYVFYFWILKETGGMLVVVGFYDKGKASLIGEFKRRGYTDYMLERLEHDGILLLCEEPIRIKENRYYVTKIRKLYEKFERDYSEIMATS